MKPRNYVLDLIRDSPKNNRTIALIRHSKRESFQGIPDHLRDSVGITNEGISMAKEFGTNINQIVPDRRLFIGHTVAKRAEMTAQSIHEGYFSQNHATIIGCKPDIISPVINFEKQISVRNKFGWTTLLNKWLNGEISMDTLWNPQSYTDEILGNLLHYPGINSGELLVVIAHDITLFPIVFSLFGKNVKGIEFLNGIVISADTNIAEIKFCNSEYSFKAEREIS